VAIEFEDTNRKVIINQRDQNKVIVQDNINKVEVAIGGPQGAPGVAGPTGPAGIQGEDGRYYVSETAPEDPQIGDAWFRSSTAQMYLRYDGFWVETSTSYTGPRGESGALGVQNLDGGSASSVYIQNQLIDGGSAASIYTQNQLINGGTAGTF
jgi:hypothetical protein